MGKIVLIISFFFAVKFLHSQPNSANREFHYSINYFGEKLLHPGLEFSLSRCFTFLKGQKDYKKKIEFGLAGSTYFHFRNHIGLRATPHFSILLRTNKGYEFGLKIDAGYMRRFYQGKFFVFDEEEIIKQKYLQGQNSLTYGAYFTIAKNFNSKKEMSLHFQIGGFQETNFNEEDLFHPAFLVGISTNINKLQK
jgi:hypothetical protein